MCLYPGGHRHALARPLLARPLPGPCQAHGPHLHTVWAYAIYRAFFAVGWSAFTQKIFVAQIYVFVHCTGAVVSSLANSQIVTAGVVVIEWNEK
jgi:hypothetical protein